MPIPVSQTIWQQYRQRVSAADRYPPKNPWGGRVYLSEATGCPRKATLRLLKFPSAPMSAQSRENTAGGIKGENHVALVFEAAGFVVERGTPVQTPYGNGKIDCLLRPRVLPADNRAHALIVEVKTTSVSSQRFLPRVYHVEQALLYQGYYREPGFPEQRLKTEVVYYLPEADQLVAFDVPWDQAHFDRLTATLEQIDGASRAGVPLAIPSEYTADNTPCTFPNTGRCTYWQHCWGDGLTQIPLIGVDLARPGGEYTALVEF